MNLLPDFILHARICPSCQDLQLRGDAFPVCKLQEWICVADRRHVVYEALASQEKAA